MIDKEKFIRRMRRQGYSQRSLAHEIGISRSSINKKINGNGCFDTVQIGLICAALDIHSGAEKTQIFLADLSQKRDNKQKKAGT